MRGIAIVVLAGLLGLGSAGCAARVHHHHEPGAAATLESEHESPKVVIVHARPHAKRACWKHRRHWHCRR